MFCNKTKLRRRQTYVFHSVISTTRAVGWIPLHSSKNPLGNFLDLPRNLTLFATHPIALGVFWKKGIIKTTTLEVFPNPANMNWPKENSEFIQHVQHGRKFIREPSQKIFTNAGCWLHHGGGRHLGEEDLHDWLKENGQIYSTTDHFRAWHFRWVASGGQHEVWTAVSSVLQFVR